MILGDPGAKAKVVLRERWVRVRYGAQRAESECPGGLLRFARMGGMVVLLSTKGVGWFWVFLRWWCVVSFFVQRRWFSSVFE